MDVRSWIFDSVAHSGLSSEMHHVREGDDVEEFRQQARVVDVSFDDEDPVVGQSCFPGFFERRVVVGVEVVEADNAVAALLEVDCHVGSDEPGRAGDQNRDPSRPFDLRRRPHLFLPLDSPPRSCEVARARVDERLEA